MKAYSGIDVIEIQRIKKAIETNEGFLDRVYTKQEQNYCESKKQMKYQSYAARFCAKEAVAKALGKGFTEGIKMTDIEIVLDQYQKPHIHLLGSAQQIYDELNIKTSDLSMSHCKTYATAVFFGLGDING